MCGRYRLALPWPELARLLGLRGPDPGYRLRYNIAPTQEALVVAPGGPDGRLMRWGFTPAWAKHPLINARAEDAALKPTWSRPLARARCLVPAQGFYEWRREGAKKAPFDFSDPDGRLLTFAGLSDEHPAGGLPEPRFALLTRPAGPEMAPVHDREPLIVPPRLREAWIDPAASGVELVAALLREHTPLSSRALGPKVNNARFDGPECLEAA